MDHCTSHPTVGDYFPGTSGEDDDLFFPIQNHFTSFSPNSSFIDVATSLAGKVPDLASSSTSATASTTPTNSSGLSLFHTTSTLDILGLRDMHLPSDLIFEAMDEEVSAFLCAHKVGETDSSQKKGIIPHYRSEESSCKAPLMSALSTTSNFPRVSRKGFRQAEPQYENIRQHAQAPVPETTEKPVRAPARVPIFEGDAYEFPTHRLLELDPSGIPALATPILEFAKENGWSIEAMLKRASIGQYNTAVRYWFRGENLFRLSVLEAAAVIVEWYEALQEGRGRRNTTINVAEVNEISSRQTPRGKGRRLSNSVKRRSVSTDDSSETSTPRMKKSKMDNASSTIAPSKKSKSELLLEIGGSVDDQSFSTVNPNVRRIDSWAEIGKLVALTATPDLF
jgi:hypothetical protein